MTPPPLHVVHVTLFPTSPATFGAQRRIQGLMGALTRRNKVTALSLVEPGWDVARAERAMREHCSEVLFVPAHPASGARKRLLQLRSLASAHSFERHYAGVPALGRALDAVLARDRVDVVCCETPAFGHLRRGRAHRRGPRFVVDNHNIEHDLVRQMTGPEQSLARRVYNALDWRKLRREELAAWRELDGAVFTSAVDEARARADVPGITSTVVANAVDVDYFRPGPGPATPDPDLVLFFGTVDYFPNRDGLGHFLRETWPLLAASHPRARLRIVGPRPTPEILAQRGPRVEVTGMVEDLRPHLAEAAVTIAPLRIGGGTRLKILEGMAMGRPVVSTALGAEGIEAVDGRDLLLAEAPAAFAAAVGRVLDDRALADRLSRAARSLVEARYSWQASGDRLEAFFRGLLGRGDPSGAAA